MEDNSNKLNKAIVLGLISGVVICPIIAKDVELHHQETFYSDTYSKYPAASGFDGVIGNQWYKG